MPKNGSLFFTDDQVKQLINEVEKRPFIWDPDHGDYNDKYLVMTSWKDISADMDVSGKLLRRKWKNLRDFHRKELTKKGKQSQWVYYDIMSFVKYRNISENNNDNEVEVDILKKEPSEVSEPEQFVKVEPTDTLFIAEEDPIPEKKRKMDSDYDMMFLKSLAPYFRQLDPMRKLVVRNKMQDMLLNEIAAQSSSKMANNIW